MKYKEAVKITKEHMKTAANFGVGKELKLKDYLRNARLNGLIFEDDQNHSDTHPKNNE